MDGKAAAIGGKALVAASIVALLMPALSDAQPTNAGSASSPAPSATATPVSPFAIPVGREIGYRTSSQQTYDAQWWFTGSLVFKVDPSGKISGGYLGDSDQDNPSYPPDPMLGRESPVTGTLTKDNKINLIIGSGSLQWNIQGTVTPTSIDGNFASTRFGLMIFTASRVHIPKHPANLQKPS